MIYASVKATVLTSLGEIMLYQRVLDLCSLEADVWPHICL